METCSISGVTAKEGGGFWTGGVNKRAGICLMRGMESKGEVSGKKKEGIAGGIFGGVSFLWTKRGAWC